MTTLQEKPKRVVDDAWSALEFLLKGGHNHMELVFVRGREMSRFYIAPPHTPVPSLRVFLASHCEEGYKSFKMDVDHERAERLFRHVKSSYSSFVYDPVGNQASVLPDFMRTPWWYQRLFGDQPLANGTSCAKMSCSALRSVDLSLDCDPERVTSQDVIFSLRKILTRVDAVTPSLFP